MRDVVELDLSGEAAKMAYYFFLSLFPFVLSVFALTGIVGGDKTFRTITAAAEAAAPSYAWPFVRDLIREITGRQRPGLLSAGIVVTLLVASNAINAFIRGLNLIYDVREERPWWKRRLLSLGILVAGVLLVVAAAATFIPGLSWLHRAGFDGVWRRAWRPAGFAALTSTLWLSYHFLPARDQRGTNAETLVGALIAASLWIAATDLCRLFLTKFSLDNRTYGAVGAVIALLTWFYISTLVVLIGGDISAVIEARRRRRLESSFTPP